MKMLIPAAAMAAALGAVVALPADAACSCTRHRVVHHAWRHRAAYPYRAYAAPPIYETYYEPYPAYGVWPAWYPYYYGGWGYGRGWGGHWRR